MDKAGEAKGGPKMSLQTIIDGEVVEDCQFLENKYS